MPRAIWSGSISFGLVNVPVKLYSAVHQQDLSFHQFEEGTNARVRNKRVSEKTGKEVDYDDIVKGYEVEKGHYVMVEPEELKEFAPRATRTIDIEDFVSLDEIDPIFYDATYYLAPEKSEGAKKAYVLLREAMEDQNKVAIGRLVMRTKQYLAAIRPYEKGMSLSTMLFHDEIVPMSDIDEIPTGRVKAASAEVKMAGQIIDSMSREWDPKRYEDTYRIQVLDFLKKKAAGEEIVVEEEPEEQADVSDLMAALEASLAAAKKGGSSRSSSSSKSSSSSSKRSSSARKAPAKKAPAKKSSSTSRRSSSSSGSKRKSA